MRRQSGWTLFALALIVGLGGCSQSPEAKEARYLAKGKKELEKDNYAAAVIHFKNAIAARPTDAEPYYRLGLSYLALGDVAPAAASLRKATDLDPKHTSAQIKLASLFSFSTIEELQKEAENRMIAVLANSPGNPEALEVLARAEAQLGKAESAEAHLLEVLQRSPERLTSAVAVAQLRLARKDSAGAEEILKQTIQQAPKSADAHVYLGDFYVNQNRNPEAEQQYRLAIAADQKHGRSLANLASLLDRAGRTAEAEQTYKTLSELPDRQYRTAHARYLMKTGKTNEGIAELSKLEIADQEDRALRTELVNAYLASDRIGDAEKLLTTTLKKNTRDVDALLQRARIYIASGKNSEAQTDLNDVLHYRSNSAEAHYLLSKISQARADQATQKQELGEVLRLQPDYLVARIEMADVLTKSGGAESALALINEAPQGQKLNAALLMQRNWALLALKRNAEAHKGIDQILTTRPVPEALLQDATLKTAEKNYGGATASIDRILSDNPGDVRALNLMLQTYTSQNQRARGVEKLRDHAMKHPELPDVQTLLGYTLFASKDRAGARAAFNAALTGKAGFVPAELGLAQIDTEEGKREDARKRLSSIVSANPTNVTARLVLAEVDLADGNVSSAVEQYRKVADTDPKNAVALNNVAYLLAEKKQPDEALKFAQLAKQLAPENPSIDDTLGWTYYQKGMYTLALPYLEKANAREDAAIRKYHLAMAYHKAGDSKRGRQMLDAARKMDSKLPEEQAAREVFATEGK